MPIESGKRYVFINKKSGTALDLDTHDNKSVQGWNRHGEPNQQWEAIQQRSHSSEPVWVLKNVQQGDYLGSEGLDDGNRIICVPVLFYWTVEQQDGAGEKVYRIATSDSKCVDLAGGNDANGTPVLILRPKYGPALLETRISFGRFSRSRLGSN